jgi:hypothetical protein
MPGMRVKPGTRKALLGFVLGGIAGALAATVVATIEIAIANSLAEDGPYFPPPLVAPLIVVPVAVVFAPFQLAALAYCLARGRLPMRGSMVLGGAGGLATGAVVNFGVFGAKADLLLGGLVLAGLVSSQGVAPAVEIAALTVARVRYTGPWLSAPW